VDVTLTCLGGQGAAEGTLYTWYRNSKRLRESWAPTLRFPSVRGEDAGAFQCRVRSSNGSDASAPVPLRVLCKCCRGVRAGGVLLGSSSAVPSMGVPSSPLSTAKELLGRNVERAEKFPSAGESVKFGGGEIQKIPKIPTHRFIESWNH